MVSATSVLGICSLTKILWEETWAHHLSPPMKAGVDSFFSKANIFKHPRGSARRMPCQRYHIPYIATIKQTERLNRTKLAQQKKSIPLCVGLEGSAERVQKCHRILSSNKALSRQDYSRNNLVQKIASVFFAPNVQVIEIMQMWTNLVTVILWKVWTVKERKLKSCFLD